MKKKVKYLPLVMVFVLFAYIVVANIMTWQTVTLQQIQTVSNDSLQYGKDWSPMVGDSVQITCKVVAPPQVYQNGAYHALLRGTDSYTCYAQDTANGVFGGIVIRKAGRVTNTNIQYIDTGYVITVKGIVQEYFGTNVNWPNRAYSGWLTQIALDSSGPITINSTNSGSRPTPKLVSITDFAVGDYPNAGGSINYVDGEKYEGMYVEIRNVTVGAGTANRQPFSIIDANGNKLYVRDFSNFFSTSPSPSYDTLRSWSTPSTGTVINYIRGVIINCNNEGSFGTQLPYAICPIYPNDLSLGEVPPSLSSSGKTPGVPTPSDSVTINVTIQSSTTLTNTSVYYRINRGAFVNKNLTLVSGNIYSTKIPPTALNNLMEYYFSATNTTGLTKLLPADTSISKFFYVVKASDSLSIQEIQYCPNRSAYSGYNGAIVRGVEGIVTADTSDFKAYTWTSHSTTFSEPARVIIQNGTGPSSGIWITGNYAEALVKGQKVRISGTVTYNYGVNTIVTSSQSDVQILSSGNTLPDPQILTAYDLANSKTLGDTTIKKWESVLVKINTPVWISCINLAVGIACTSHQTLPDTVFRRNYGEIGVTDNTNTQARILLPGANHTYHNGWDTLNISGRTLLTQNDSISYIQGVLYYAYSNYKICPRTNADFGTVTPVGIKNVSSNVVKSFKLNQNYPNPFNPVTRIGFSLPMNSKVTVKVYDVLGRQIQTLVNENLNAGSFLIDFNGSEFASGVYFVRMTAIGRDGANFADTKKMLLVK
jgi:hypothetical protein